MISIDVAWKSLNKKNEELCGDKVEVLYTDDSVVMILADGMGSGVKANILATLTSKILATMFKEGATIDLAVETIVKTLPICSERQVAYSTFSILQVSHNGDAYLVEFDNPSCIFIRDKKIQNYPYKERVMAGKKIREYRFKANVGDCFVLMSDGVVWAGEGEIMNYNWTWDEMSEYSLVCSGQTRSAARMTTLLSDMCNDLYGGKPGDDTTVAVMRLVERKIVSVMTGPPKNKEDDETMIREFMNAKGMKIVSGGTSSNIVSRVLNKPITTNAETATDTIPPTANIDGMDLVVEGVVTLTKVIALLKRYASNEMTVEFFDELDANNGASQLAKIIIEECTELHMFVGKAKNAAYGNKDIPFEVSLRQNVVKELKDVAEHIGKTVVIKYY